MERVFRWIYDAVMLGCIVITTIFTYLIWAAPASPPVPTVESGVVGPSVPWWVFGIGTIGVALLIVRIGFFFIDRFHHNIEFFRTRHELHRKYLSLENRVKEVSTLWAIWAVGTKFVDSSSSNVLKRLILPNPDSSSSESYFNSINQNHVRMQIRPTTLKAMKAGIEVRWSDEFFFHSITIADPSSPNGWAYIEHALPYCMTEERPGYTIHRKGQPEAVSDLIKEFETIWSKAKVVTSQELARSTNSPPQFEPIHKVVSHVAARIADNDATKFWPNARLAIRQAALDGSIQIYGQKSEDTGNPHATSWSGVRIPIPQAYWELADITEGATSAVYANELMSNTRPHRLSDDRFTQEKIEYYTKLTAKWDEVRLKWP